MYAVQKFLKTKSFGFLFRISAWQVVLKSRHFNYVMHSSVSFWILMKCTVLSSPFNISNAAFSVLFSTPSTLFLRLPFVMFQVDSSRASRLLPHCFVIRGGIRPREESLRLVPVQSSGPAGEEDRRESGEILQLLRQHVPDGLQAASKEGRRYHLWSHTQMGMCSLNMWAGFWQKRQWWTGLIDLADWIYLDEVVWMLPRTAVLGLPVFFYSPYRVQPCMIYKSVLPLGCPGIKRVELQTSCRSLIPHHSEFSTFKLS